MTPEDSSPVLRKSVGSATVSAETIPAISSLVPLNGAAKSALILKALRAGVAAACNDLQALYQAAGQDDMADAKHLTYQIHALIKEFTDSLERSAGKSPDRAAYVKGPFRARQNQKLHRENETGPDEFARNLQREHSSVMAIALNGKATKYAARVLRLIETDQAQRAVLHFANISKTKTTSKAARIIRHKLR